MNYCLKHKPLVVKMLKESVEKVEQSESSNLYLESSANLDLQRIKSFLKLIKSDGVIDESELGFILPIIDEINVDGQTKQMLKSSLEESKDIEIDYSQFNGHEDKISLINDLIFLAKIDNDFDDSEKGVIREIALGLGISDGEIGDLLR